MLDHAHDFDQGKLSHVVRAAELELEAAVSGQITRAKIADAVFDNSPPGMH